MSTSARGLFQTPRDPQNPPLITPSFTPKDSFQRLAKSKTLFDIGLKGLGDKLWGLVVFFPLSGLFGGRGVSSESRHSGAFAASALTSWKDERFGFRRRNALLIYFYGVFFLATGGGRGGKKKRLHLNRCSKGVE